MNKRLKEDIVASIQGGITLGMMLVGFMTTHLIIWRVIGFPMEWYAVVIAILLSLLSMGGLVSWIENT